jgi:hypothetical protein
MPRPPARLAHCSASCIRQVLRVLACGPIPSDRAPSPPRHHATTYRKTLRRMFYVACCPVLAARFCFVASLHTACAGCSSSNVSVGSSPSAVAGGADSAVSPDRLLRGAAGRPLDARTCIMAAPAGVAQGSEGGRHETSAADGRHRPMAAEAEVAAAAAADESSSARWLADGAAAADGDPGDSPSDSALTICGVDVKTEHFSLLTVPPGAKGCTGCSAQSAVRERSAKQPLLSSREGQPGFRASAPGTIMAHYSLVGSLIHSETHRPSGRTVD